MLAQLWLEGRRIKSPYDAYVDRHLRLPDKFNPYSSVAVLNRLAERIVFTDDVPSLLYEMYTNKQLTYEGVITSARLPFDCFWLEYPSTIGIEEEEIQDGVQRVEYGAVIQRTSSEDVRMFIVMGIHRIDSPPTAGLIYIVDFPVWPPLVTIQGHSSVQLKIAYSYLSLEGEKEGEISSRSPLGSIVSEMIFGIFLVTQPRVYSDEVVSLGNKHALARIKRGKLPLLDYRRIRLRIGHSSKRYSNSDSDSARQSQSQRQRTALTLADSVDTDSPAAVQHRRYHKVMGHFRHYIKINPHSVWIEPHYRGDPALGVTFTERDVSR